MNFDPSNDHVVSAFAEYAHGPGWSNMPVWVIVANRDGTLRQECLQPDEQTADIHALYRVSAAAHADMCAAVEAKLRGRPWVKR